MIKNRNLILRYNTIQFFSAFPRRGVTIDNWPWQPASSFRKTTQRVALTLKNVTVQWKMPVRGRLPNIPSAPLAPKWLRGCFHRRYHRQCVIFDSRFAHHHTIAMHSNFFHSPMHLIGCRMSICLYGDIYHTHCRVWKDPLEHISDRGGVIDNWIEYPRYYGEISEWVCTCHWWDISRWSTVWAIKTLYIKAVHNDKMLISRLHSVTASNAGNISSRDKKERSS